MIILIWNQNSKYCSIDFELKQCHSEEDVISQCQDADALIVQYAHITKKVMDALPKLKMVVRYGVGVDTIDIEEATKHNIQICNVPDYGMNEVADHAIALMMAMTRKIVLMNNFTKSTNGTMLILFQYIVLPHKQLVLLV